MKIGVILQARMSSQRLPGKVMRKVMGKCLLEYTLERIQKAEKADLCVVATSDQESDDPIANYCGDKGFNVYRGSLNNVAERFCDVIREFSLDAFVRISGDSPLIDQELINRAIDLFAEGDYQIVTNILERSFPKGESIEVLDSQMFLDSFPLIRENEDLEHVTRFFYNNKENIKIHNFLNDENWENVQLSVDTVEDFNIFVEIMKRLERPHWEYSCKDLIKLHSEINIAA